MYVANCGCCLKVGCSKAPADRVKSFQTSNPNAQLLHQWYFEDMYRAEKLVLDCLRPYRVLLPGLDTKAGRECHRQEAYSRIADAVCLAQMAFLARPMEQRAQLVQKAVKATTKYDYTLHDEQLDGLRCKICSHTHATLQKARQHVFNKHNIGSDTRAFRRNEHKTHGNVRCCGMNFDGTRCIRERRLPYCPLSLHRQQAKATTWWRELYEVGQENSKCSTDTWLRPCQELADLAHQAILAKRCT